MRKDNLRASNPPAAPVPAVTGMTGTPLIPMRRRWLTFSLISTPIAILLATGLFTSSRSQTPPPAAIDYLPSVSDLMIATIQPRHERLWRAAKERNWDFAAYELGNLHGAFDRLGRAHPTVQNTSLPDMIASVTEQPFKDLKLAIDAKDDAAFATAYSDLTDACNSCHQALNHGIVAIGVPGGASQSDLMPASAPR